eukprot:snap_masked-scaffold_44-processed-gene-1.81-mRNA-1 protein AED:1.00 eAED:1.00 QI:0/-1/0/0/-1/1/1/0/236
MAKGKRKQHKHPNRNKQTLVVANPTSHTFLTTQEQKLSKTLHLGLYNNKQRLLFVGEGDFSFSAALCTSFGGNNIVATSLDSKKLLKQKYSSAIKNTKLIKSTGGKIFYSFDVTKIHHFNYLAQNIPHFDITIFNFPHIGGSTKKDVFENISVLKLFVDCIYSSKISSQIHITLRDNIFYNSWKIKEVLSQKYKVQVQNVDFSPYTELGYKEVRTNPAAREAPEIDKIKTYSIKLN